jgi:hypothetical protein
MKLNLKRTMSARAREVLEAETFELELFEKYELKLLLQDLKIHGDLSNADAMNAMAAASNYGLRGELDLFPTRGRTVTEIGYVFYQVINGDKNIKRIAFVSRLVADCLRKTLIETNDEIPF